MDKYNNYNSRVAETMTEIFLKKHSYLVQPYGVEKQIGIGIDLINNNDLSSNTSLKQAVKKYMTMPDLVAIKLDNKQSINQLFFIDVKYRTINSQSEFDNSIKNGDMNSQAKKYKKRWDGAVFIFLIAKLENTMAIYYDSVNNISNGEMKKLSEYSWVNKQYLDELMNHLTSFYIN